MLFGNGRGSRYGMDGILKAIWLDFGKIAAGTSLKNSAEVGLHNREDELNVHCRGEIEHLYIVSDPIGGQREDGHPRPSPPRQ